MLPRSAKFVGYLPWIPEVLWFQCLQSILACNDAKLLQRHLEAVLGPAAQRSTAWCRRRLRVRTAPWSLSRGTWDWTTQNGHVKQSKPKVFHWQRECVPLAKGMCSCISQRWSDWLLDDIASIADWLIDWLIGWLIDWLIVWLIDWLVDWLGDWLVGWLVGTIY